MKNNLVIIVFLCFICQMSFCQKIKNRANILVKNQEFGQCEFKYYENKVKMVKGQKNTFKDGSLEYFFLNFFNAKNKGALSLFFQNGEVIEPYSNSNYFENMINYQQNPLKNYYELDAVMELDKGYKKSILIKYINHNEKFPKPIACLFYMEQDSEGFKINRAGSDLSDLMFFFISIKSKVISDYFSNKLLEKDKKLLDTYIVDGFFDFKKISIDFSELHRKNPKHSLNELLYDSQYSFF